MRLSRWVRRWIFLATEALRALALDGRAGLKRELAQGLRAERTPRELRLTIEAASAVSGAEVIPEYSVEIPGEIKAPVFGLRLRIKVSSNLSGSGPAREGVKDRGAISENYPSGAKAHDDLAASSARLKSCPDTKPLSAQASGNGSAADGVPVDSNDRVHALKATLRNWRPGDRVRLRYSGGPRKVKEVLERLRVTGSSRAIWPVLEVDGRIVWMKGVEVEPEQGIAVTAAELHDADAIGITEGSGDGTLE